MCCIHSYPAPRAEIFNKLQKGSVVVLLKGAGDPQVEMVSTIEVILDVDGFSALTNMGRMLNCHDATLMDVTGEHLDEGEYVVALKAQEKLHQAELAKARRDAEWQEIFDGFDPKNDPLDLL